MNTTGGEVLAGGNMNPVVRAGDEVRRSLPIGWRGSHAVLRHLAAREFPYAPRLLRHDQQHEWLTYMPGESLQGSTLAGLTSDVIVQIGHLIRAYHEAMADFTIPPDVTWTPQFGIPDGPRIVCHCDVAPWNTVWRDGRITGLIDWDLVHPAPPAWDLAYAAWRFAPLYDEPHFGTVETKARHIRLLLDAYGLTREQRTGFVGLIRQRARAAFDTVETLGQQGVPGFASLHQQRLHLAGLPIAWIDRHRTVLVRLIE